jgi:hypothetical protein
MFQTRVWVRKKAKATGLHCGCLGLLELLGCYLDVDLFGDLLLFG